MILQRMVLQWKWEVYLDAFQKYRGRGDVTPLNKDPQLSWRVWSISHKTCWSSKTNFECQLRSRRCPLFIPNAVWQSHLTRIAYCLVQMNFCAGLCDLSAFVGSKPNEFPPKATLSLYIDAFSYLASPLTKYRRNTKFCELDLPLLQSWLHVQFPQCNCKTIPPKLFV